MVGEEGADCPGGGEDADDKEDEDVVRCEGIVRGIDVYEVCQHAKGWDQSNNLHESPKGEEDSEKHLDGLSIACAKVSIA